MKNRYAYSKMLKRMVGIWKSVSKNKKREKLRFLVVFVCFLSLALLSFFRTAPSPAKSSEPSPVQRQAGLSPEENPDKDSLRSPNPSTLPGRSFIKMNLLKESQSPLDSSVEKMTRNIFVSATSLAKDEPPPQKEEPEEIKPVINVKFVGIIEVQAELPQKGIVRNAILSMGGEIFIVKKGDVVNNQYEIMNIEEEAVEIRIKDSGYTEKLTIEKD